MKIFGPEAAALGSDRVCVGIQAGSTCGDVLRLLHSSFPDVCLVGVHRLAVNHIFVGDGDVIDVDDEVALIGLVSGG